MSFLPFTLSHVRPAFDGGVKMQRIILAVFILGFVVSSAFAQGAGQVNGVVADTGGGVIPGVTVIAVEKGGAVVSWRPTVGTSADACSRL